ncbi:40S ribosomal protein S10 [Trichinella patagoniensis]|uniref:40S ribosomal protein S10 n=1 Tax=Trichinella patagoniensis TaxID=990121 RepID=A0A0V1AFK7_9BILA|nr:40S ribosomal protein S10 [Trichinella patagoniensis]
MEKLFHRMHVASACPFSSWTPIPRAQMFPVINGKFCHHLLEVHKIYSTDYINFRILTSDISHKCIHYCDYIPDVIFSLGALGSCKLYCSSIDKIVDSEESIASLILCQVGKNVPVFADKRTAEMRNPQRWGIVLIAIDNNERIECNCQIECFFPLFYRFQLRTNSARGGHSLNFFDCVRQNFISHVVSQPYKLLQDDIDEDSLPFLDPSVFVSIMLTELIIRSKVVTDTTTCDRVVLDLPFLRRACRFFTDVISSLRRWENRIPAELNTVELPTTEESEGVCVARKDFYLMKHPVIGVPNLYVIKSMQSLLSRNYVKEQFAWRHYYWTLTNEGISYLRTFLNLPAEIVPATVRRPQKPDARGGVERGFGGPPGKMGDGDSRDMYRKGIDKTAEAGIGAGGMEMRGGFGRGKPF